MCYLIFFGNCPGTVSKVLREIEMSTRLWLEPAFSKNIKISLDKWKKII